MDDSPGTLELLSSRVDELEKRVHALEHPHKSLATVPKPEGAVDRAIDTESVLETGRLLPILGRAMLGIAGAYVLRAVAEAGVLPKLAVSAVAVAYAFGWLVWSARSSLSLARVVYAATSALILAPMLWENTLAFQVFTPMTTAGILAAFMTLATVLEIRDGAMRSMWIAQSIALLVTAALAFATHHMLPFVMALLLAVFVSEFARQRDFAQPVWPLLVLVTDGVLAGLIFIYSGPQDARAVYPELSIAALISPAALLFAIDGTAVAIRGVARGSRVNIFEVMQVVVAFSLAVTATVSFAPQQSGLILGVICLVLAAFAYFSAFRVLRSYNDRRNFRVFAMWSAALLIAGSLWTFSRTGAGIVLAFAAVGAMYAATRMERKMLEFHSAVFLVVALVVAELPSYLYGTMAGTPHYPTAAIVIVSLCAGVSVAVAKLPVDSKWVGVLDSVPAMVALCGLTSLLVHGALAGAAAFMKLEVQHVAFLRTLTICGVALAVAFGTSLWGRAGLTRLAYVALAFVASKLLFEDMQHGHMGFVAGSISLFAIALIAAPRLVRLGARWCHGANGGTPIPVAHK